MSKSEYKELTRRLSRMESKNVEKPYDAIEEFFSSFSLQDCRYHLWELYERCVMCYAREGTEHDEASDILFFYTHTEMLIEAAWLINNKKAKKRKKTNETLRTNIIKTP